jgi:hypothetical protein
LLNVGRERRFEFGVNLDEAQNIAQVFSALSATPVGISPNLYLPAELVISHKKNEHFTLIVRRCC